MLNVLIILSDNCWGKCSRWIEIKWCMLFCSNIVNTNLTRTQSSFFTDVSKTFTQIRLHLKMFKQIRLQNWLPKKSLIFETREKENGRRDHWARVSKIELFLDNKFWRCICLIKNFQVKTYLFKSFQDVCKKRRLGTSENTNIFHYFERKITIYVMNFTKNPSIFKIKRDENILWRHLCLCTVRETLHPGRREWVRTRFIMVSDILQN